MGEKKGKNLCNCIKISKNIYIQTSRFLKIFSILIFKEELGAVVAVGKNLWVAIQ